MKPIPFLDLNVSNAGMEEEVSKAAARVIRSGRYINGPEASAFEAELARHTGTNGCVATSNGLDSLKLIFRALMELGRMKPGDKVMTAANTYIATVLPLVELGLTPVLYDADPLTMNLAQSGIRDCAERGIRAVVPVHLYGNPCLRPDDWRKLREQGIIVVEDNAQGIGAMAADENGEMRRCGSMGDAAAFSFYPTKNIGALGDAGAVCSSDMELLDCVRALANYGSDTRYHNIYRGYNARMDELQAAILRVKLRHIDKETARRREIATIYDREIVQPNIIKPITSAGTIPNRHQYVVRSRNRDELRHYLSSRGIGTDIHYPTPLYRQPCFLRLLDSGFPTTEMLSREVISLPIGSATQEQAKAVAQEINRFNHHLI